MVGFTTSCAISAYHHKSFAFKPRSWRGVLETTLCCKVCQWLATGRFFSLGTTVTSTNKTNCHDITEILLKVVLNTVKHQTIWKLHWMEITATTVSFLVKMLVLVEDMCFKSVTIFNFGTICVFSVWFDCQQIISKITYNFHAYFLNLYMNSFWKYRKPTIPPFNEKYLKIAREFMWLDLNGYFPIREYCKFLYLFYILEKLTDIFNPSLGHVV